MSVRLRAHHVLCILTFAGKGYSPAFIANMAAIVARIGAGESIELIDGPDDICAPLDGTGDEHCGNAPALAADREARRQLGLGETLILDAGAIEALRIQFAAGTIRGACAGCQWHDLCSEIAGAGYAVAAL